MREYLNTENENITRNQVQNDTEQDSLQKHESEEDSKSKIYSTEEQKNSNRIFKSATPKYTVDWYVKWFSSVVLICAISIRSAQINPLLDLILSFTGMVGWTYVSIVWKDSSTIQRDKCRQGREVPWGCKEVNSTGNFSEVFSKLPDILSSLLDPLVYPHRICPSKNQMRDNL